MRITVCLTALGAIVSSGLPAQSPSDSLCIFSGRERSTLAWESAARSGSGGGVFGRVVVLRDSHPVTSGVITLEPGLHRASLDSAGRFEIKGAPNGRYLLRIRSLGFPTLADSIT